MNFKVRKGSLCLRYAQYGYSLPAALCVTDAPALILHAQFGYTQPALTSMQLKICSPRLVPVPGFTTGCAGSSAGVKYIGASVVGILAANAELNFKGSNRAASMTDAIIMAETKQSALTYPVFGIPITVVPYIGLKADGAVDGALRGTASVGGGFKTSVKLG